MYSTIGKLATSVVAIIITDVLMEKYDVRRQIKKRYTQTCTAATGLASKVRSHAGQDESATTEAEAQETSRLTRRERYRIWEARLQYRLARRALWSANWKADRAKNHASYCAEVAEEYKRNYIRTVPLRAWAGPEGEALKEIQNV